MAPRLSPVYVNRFGRDHFIRRGLVPPQSRALEQMKHAVLLQDLHDHMQLLQWFLNHFDVPVSPY